MPTSQHRRFDGGMNQDEASFLLPEGQSYSSKNMLFDKLGVARKRGGITTPLAGTQAADYDYLGALTTDENLVRIYAKSVAAAKIGYFNQVTGVTTTMGGSAAVLGDILRDGGRPFVHYGNLIWPCFSSDYTAGGIGFAAVGGAIGLVGFTFGTPATVVLTAGDKLVPCAVADNPLTNMQVGMIIVAYYTGGTRAYVGRVTRLVSTTSFEVFPTPTITTGACSSVRAQPAHWSVAATLAGQKAYIGGKIGMSFGGRALFGNISRKDTSGANRLELFPRRVQFSSTLLEGDAATTPLAQGAVWLTNQGYPDANYFDIGGSDPLTAMSPTGFGDALFFSAFRTWRLTGNLSTQYGTEQSATWAVREIPNSVGCMSERSLQRSPRGVIFAHHSGIYVTDGTSMKPLMINKLTNYWRGLVKGASFAIWGSALIRGNHYYISGTSNSTPWSLMLNLDTLAWGYHEGGVWGPSTPRAPFISSSVQDPSNPAITWGLTYIESTSGPLNFGQLVRLDAMFDPTSTNRADSDGTTVSFELVTGSYSEKAPMQRKDWKSGSLEYKNTGGAAVTVRPAHVLDSAELPAAGTLYALPKQDIYTVTGGTNAAPIVLTIGAGHTIAVDSWVTVRAVVGLTGANGAWRVQAVSGTTVTLMGSVGNAAWSSGGTVQNLDTREFPLDVAVTSAQGINNANSGAIAYRINDTDSGGAIGADEFELYGIMHSWEGLDSHSE